MAKHSFCITASFVVFMLFLGTGRTDIVVVPNNSEIQIGGSTYFNCSTSITSEEIHWFHYPIGSHDRSFVYSFNQFQPPYLGRFSMEKNDTSGEYNLVITSVKAEDAGKYECQDKAGSGMKQSAQLIILDTELVCQSNVNVDEVVGPNACGIKPDLLILSCMAQYRGNEAPILQWGLNGSNTPITSGVTHQINGNSVVYNLSMTTDQISNGSTYVCQTTRSTTKISCKSGEVKVVGSTKTQGASDDDGNCDSYWKAIICTWILLVLPLFITVIVLFLVLTKPKILDNIRDCLPCTTKSTEVSKDAENQQPTTEETEEPIKAEASETNQKLEEANDVDKPLLSNQSEESSSVQESQNKNLENDVKTLQELIGQQDQTIKELQRNDEHNKRRIGSLQQKNKQLQDKVKYLEQHLYPKENIGYKDKPDLAHTLQLSGSKKGKSINGITVLGDELFVVTEGSEDLEVYDSKTFHFEGNRKVKGLADPLDIASTKADKCLYIIDRVSEETESKITRIDPLGNVLHQWPTGGGKGRLSTNQSNIILCLFEKQVINEYSPNGDIIVTVRLSPAANLNHPWHAIKVTSAHFVVSHGDVDDNMHRVCVVDLDGNIQKECTKWEKSKSSSKKEMKVPICLAEDNERSIIVADRENKRILLLNSQLTYKSDLIMEEHGLKGFPVRLCFDDKQSRLFVVVNKRSFLKKDLKDDCILIFNIK